MGKEDKYLNTDFRIVVSYDRKEGEPRKRHLLGRRGLINLVGIDLYHSMISRAYKSNS